MACACSFCQVWGHMVAQDLVVAEIDQEGEGRRGLPLAKGLRRLSGLIGLVVLAQTDEASTGD